MASSGWVRGGVYRRWKWSQERHLPLVLQPRAATFAPAAAVVSVVANSPTLVATAPPLVPLAKLHSQVTVRWRLYQETRRSWRVQAPTDGLLYIPVASGNQTLSPGVATVTVAAQDPTLVRGNPPYQPVVREDLARFWRAYKRPRARVSHYRLLVHKVVPINPPFAPPTAVVSVVANDAQLFRGAALYFPQRLPVAVRWGQFVRTGRPQVTRPLPPPAPAQTLAPTVAVVTVTANDITLGMAPTNPLPHTKLRHPSPVRHWGLYLAPWGPVQQRAYPVAPFQVVLRPPAAVVTVVANDPTLVATLSLAPPTAIVTVTANDAFLQAGTVAAPPVHRRDDAAVHWNWRAKWSKRRQRARPRVGLTVAVPQVTAAPVATVTVVGNDAVLVPGTVALAPPVATVAVVAQTPALLSQTALVPSAGVVTVVANSPALTVSAVALTPGVAIVTVFATTSTLVGGAPVTVPVTARRWWRRYYNFAGGGDR